jgi:hypothetical protein
LANDLSLAQADQTILGDLYDDLMLELGRIEPWLTSVAMIQSLNGTSSYVPQPEVIEILSIFYDENHLSQVGEQELEDTEELWRDIKGHPIVFTIDDENRKVFRVYPKPDADGAAFGGGLGEITYAEAIYGGDVPLGSAFSTGAISLLYSSKRASFLPYMEFPVAFLLLQREFMLESAHRDEGFASACGALGTLFMEMIRDGRGVF